MSANVSNPLDPLNIYQEHLDVLSTALVTGDLDTFASRLRIPHTVITEDIVMDVTSHAQLKELFYSLHRSLSGQRVTAQVRIAKEATLLDETRICGLHETHLMSDGIRIVPPYPNRVRLELIDGAWLETASSNAISQSPKAFTIPKVAENPHLRELPNSDPKRNTK